MTSLVNLRNNSDEFDGMIDKDRHDDRRRASAILDLRALGLVEASGFRTVECALIHYWQQSSDKPVHLKLLAYEEVLIPPNSRDILLSLIRDLGKKLSLVARLNNVLGRIFLDVADRFTQKHCISLKPVDFISLHVGMEFALVSSAIARVVNTDSRWNNIVASEMGITTVTNFRPLFRKSNHSAPPLATFANVQLFRHATKFRVCLDIGDFTSLSFMPSATVMDSAKTIGRACGPGNMFINYAMQYVTSNRLKTDHEGTWGARGSINFGIVDRFLNTHDYLDKGPPPEMLVEMFGNHEAQDLVEECMFLGMTYEDIIATVTRVTVENIARQYRRLLADHFHPDMKVDELLICGAGSKNVNITEFIASELTQTTIMALFEDFGMTGEAKQAVSYAYMGLNIALGEIFQPFTVSDEWKVTGDIVYGRRWKEGGQQVLEREGDKLQQDQLHETFLNNCHSPVRSAISISELLCDPVLFNEYGQS